MIKRFTAFFLFSALFYLPSSGQSIQELLTQQHAECRDVFMNVPDVLAGLYRKKAFDSMHVALNIWQQYCGNTPELFYAKTLLSIEESRFSPDDLPDSGFTHLISPYAERLSTIKIYEKEAPSYEGKFYQFIQAWAKLLLENKKLDINAMFLCNVFAGNIGNPEKELKTNPGKYNQLYALLKKDYAKQRDGVHGNITFISGVWLPTKDLKILGAHPSLGMQVGGRNKRNQLDLTMQFRFTNTPNYYYILRNDSLYRRNHFDGGYIGADYTFYFIHKTSFECGWLGGLGFDGFDIANSDRYNHQNDYLKPLSINSFNFNSGLRLNYFFNPGFYLGIQGRYNWINYGNKGGSSLQGDAFSIDLIVGGNF